MNGIYETMLNQHNLDNEDARQNAHYEVMQQVILGGFTEEASLKKLLSTEAHVLESSMD